MNDENVAIYLDFENLALSAEEVYPSAERPMKVEPIVDYAATKGNICIKRAYADWSKYVFRQYQNEVMEQGFELIHLPSTTSQGKNGSDVQMAIDAMENMERYKHIDTIILGSGDSDFIPLIQRMRARGKIVILTGFEHSVGRLVKVNSLKYISLEELIGKPDEDSLATDYLSEIDQSHGKDLVIRYLRNISGDRAIQMSKLKTDLLRLDPTFSEKKFGFQSFKTYVESLKDEIVDRIELDTNNLPIVYFKEGDFLPKQPVSYKKLAEAFLKKPLRYVSRADIRSEIAKAMHEAMQEIEELSMRDVKDDIFKRTTGIPKITIRHFINTLFSGRNFEFTRQEMYLPLLSRPLKLNSSIKDDVAIETAYLNRIFEIIHNQYPNLADDDIKQLMNI